MGASDAALVGVASVVPITVLVLIAIRARYHDETIERRLNDPPRPDFTTATRPRRRNFHPDALGNSPLERSARSFLMAMLLADARLEATVRAEERELGARDAGDIEHAAARGQEADRYAREGALLQAEIQRTSLAVSVQLEEAAPSSSADRAALAYALPEVNWEAPLIETLPSRVIDAARTAGTLERDLSRAPSSGPDGSSLAAPFGPETLAVVEGGLGRPIIVAGAQSGETARLTRAALPELAPGMAVSHEAAQTLLYEVEPGTLSESAAEQGGPAERWHLDVEPDAGRYRWLLVSSSDRVAAVSAKRFDSRSDALLNARLAADLNLTFTFYEVGPSRFEWQATGPGGTPVLESRSPLRSKSGVQRAMSEVRENLRRIRIT